MNHHNHDMYDSRNAIEKVDIDGEEGYLITCHECFDPTDHNTWHELIAEA